MKLIFMGTPDFAKKHLEALIESEHEVLACITQPDKPKGRKKILTAPPVKECALKYNIPVYQPESLKDGAIQDILEKYNPEIIIVVAYGKILPSYVLEYPKHGCINVHGSLLPKYRGASPVQSALIDGEKETGITVMYMDKGLDTGDMILKKSCPIEINDNQITLFEKLEVLGCTVLLDALYLINEGKALRTKQNDEESSYATMLSSETGLIDWKEPSEKVHNLIRGTYPWPCAYSFYGGKKFKITKSVIAEGSGKAGEIIASSFKEGLVIACSSGAIKAERVQFEGGKEMDSKDYLRGHEMIKGSFVGE